MSDFQSHHHPLRYIIFCMSFRLNYKRSKSSHEWKILTKKTLGLKLGQKLKWNYKWLHVNNELLLVETRFRCTYVQSRTLLYLLRAYRVKKEFLTYCRHLIWVWLSTLHLLKLYERLFMHHNGGITKRLFPLWLR